MEDKTDSPYKNMNAINYQKELDKILDGLEKQKNANGRDISAGAESPRDVPRLFLHSCCAPCSSYVLEYLCPYFEITVFYYNPNISSTEEYQKRAREQKRLIGDYNEEMAQRLRQGYPIKIVEGDHEPGRFYEAVKGYEDCPEGGQRCFRCFDLRLRETAKRAKEGAFDYFATTLTISPLKNARKLNEIGMALSEEYKVPWLPSDFKKREGYKRSIQLSLQYGLYRQNYCGCGYSLRSSGK